MADGVVQVSPDSTGKKVDTSELTVNAQTVERQRVALSDATDPVAHVSVKSANPASSDYGLVVRSIPAPSDTVLAGQQAVTATAAALATHATRRVFVKALISNALTVYVGPVGVTTATGHELVAGEGISLDVSNTNLIYVIASSTGASVSWIVTS